MKSLHFYEASTVGIHFLGQLSIYWSKSRHLKCIRTLRVTDISKTEFISNSQVIGQIQILGHIQIFVYFPDFTRTFLNPLNRDSSNREVTVCTVCGYCDVTCVCHRLRCHMYVTVCCICMPCSDVFSVYISDTTNTRSYHR